MTYNKSVPRVDMRLVSLWWHPHQSRECVVASRLLGDDRLTITATGRTTSMYTCKQCGQRGTWPHKMIREKS